MKLLIWGCIYICLNPSTEMNADDSTYSPRGALMIQAVTCCDIAMAVKNGFISCEFAASVWPADVVVNISGHTSGWNKQGTAGPPRQIINQTARSVTKMRHVEVGEAVCPKWNNLSHLTWPVFTWHLALVLRFRQFCVVIIDDNLIVVNYWMR